MSGAYSRWSFQSWRDFAAAFLQQGRVLTDADWNEWISIVLRRLHVETIDLAGRVAVPSETAGAFRVGFDNGEPTLGLGRPYVGGLLAENHGYPAATEWNPTLAE